MKPLFAVLAVGSLVFGTLTSAKAQAVLSANTAFTSESQVLTTGTEVFGGNENFTSQTLADGVSFNTQLENATYEGTSLSGITVDTDGSYYGGHVDEQFSDGALNAVLDGDAVGEYGQIFVKGLTMGDTYVIQVFASMTKGDDIGGGSNNPNSVYYGTETFDDETYGGSTSLSYGQPYDTTSMTYTGTGAYFFTDTFTATSSQEYLLSPGGQSTNNTVLIAAVQIREIPEPSTYALIGLGLLAFVVIGRFRKLEA